MWFGDSPPTLVEALPDEPCVHSQLATRYPWITERQEALTMPCIPGCLFSSLPSIYAIPPTPIPYILSHTVLPYG